MRPRLKSPLLLLPLLLLVGCPGGDPITECSTDADCPGAERCVSGDCQLLGGGPCTVDADCAAGETCQQGFCGPGAGLCASDLDCDAGEICDLLTGSCRSTTGGCQRDGDCAPPGTVCEASECVAGCATTGCLGTEVCSPTTGRCEPDTSGCQGDLQCGPPAQVCEAGSCVAGCVTAGCPTEAYCDTADGRCVAGCRDDGDCSAPGRICDAGSGTCADGCGAAGCGGGEVCNTGTGRCEVDTSCAADGDCAPPDSVCDASVTPGTCVAGCTVTGGCATETYCGPATGRCEPGCLGDGDCAPPGRVCDTAAVTCTDGCATTGCNVGNTCNTLTGHCEPGCAGDPDCNMPTDVCEGGACVPGCGSAGCTSGNLCDAGTGRCYPGCTVDADCNTPAEVCDPSAGPAGNCIAGCATGGCSTGTYCDGATGHCNPGCLADTDCDLPLEVCDTSTTPGTCTPGCFTAGCTAGQLCAGATTGRCEPPGTVALGQPCTEHAECQSDVCLVLPTGGLCTQACSASGQCPNDFWCLDALGAPGSFLCWHESQFSTNFGNDLAGAFCNAGNNDCKSGWCNTQQNLCTDTCQRDGDCAPAGPGGLCQHLTYNGGSLSDLVCGPGYGGGNTGTICDPFADPDATGCARGACLSYGATALCADPCCSSHDCPSGYGCANVAALGGTVFRMCVQDSLAVGTGAVGAACDPATGAPCRSGICLTDALGSFCSDTCCTQADCGLNLRCESVPLPDPVNPTEIIPLCLRR